MSAPDTSPEFFQSMFDRSADPWNFAVDEYEQSRYRTIVAALKPGPYRRALEPGCSVGVLTEMLAAFCVQVDASDFSQGAVDAARMRCGHLSNVTVTCASFARYECSGGYDLVVLSEIGYYFTAATWRHRIHCVVDALEPGGTLLLSHWLGLSPDHRMSGDQVHGLVDNPLLRHDYGGRYPDAERGGFRLDRWKKAA